MGRTSKPLTLLVADELAGSEEVKKLAAQGHHIDRIGGMQYMAHVYDLILAPNAQLMTKAHLKYLPEAIKRARKVKYGERDQGEDGSEGLQDGGTDTLETGGEILHLDQEQDV